MKSLNECLNEALDNSVINESVDANHIKELVRKYHIDWETVAYAINGLSSFMGPNTNIYTEDAFKDALSEMNDDKSERKLKGAVYDGGSFNADLWTAVACFSGTLNAAGCWFLGGSNAEDDDPSLRDGGWDSQVGLYDIPQGKLLPASDFKKCLGDRGEVYKTMNNMIKGCSYMIFPGFNIPGCDNGACMLGLTKKDADKRDYANALISAIA